MAYANEAATAACMAGGGFEEGRFAALAGSPGALPQAPHARAGPRHPPRATASWTPAGRRLLSLTGHSWLHYRVNGRPVVVAFLEEGGAWSFKAKPNARLLTEPAFETPPNAVDAWGRPVFIAPHAAPLSTGVDRLFIACPTAKGAEGDTKVVLQADAKDRLGDRCVVQPFNFIRVHRQPLVVAAGQAVRHGHTGEPYFVARASYKAASGRPYFHAQANALIDGEDAYVSPWFGMSSTGRQMHFAEKCNAIDELGQPVYMATALARLQDGEWLFAEPCRSEFDPGWFDLQQRREHDARRSLASVADLMAEEAPAPFR